MRCAIVSSVGINPTPIRDQYLISVLSPTLILGQHLRFVLSPKAIPNDMVENTRYLGESDILTTISSTLVMYNVVFMSSLINLKNAAIKICSWHVHLFAGQFLHDSGGVSMFQWQWMFLSFPFYVFNLHWRMCFSNGENTCYEHQNINEFPVHTKANCVINLSSNLIVPR